MKFIIWIAVFVILIVATAHDRTIVDNTDDGDRKSYLNIYVDHYTGCQYLGRAFGGLTPRLDQDGKQICQKEHK